MNNRGNRMEMHRENAYKARPYTVGIDYTLLRESSTHSHENSNTKMIDRQTICSTTEQLESVLIILLIVPKINKTGNGQ